MRLHAACGSDCLGPSLGIVRSRARNPLERPFEHPLQTRQPLPKLGNIPLYLLNAPLYLLETPLHLLETLVHLIKALVYLLETLVHLIKALVYLLETLVYVVRKPLERPEQRSPQSYDRPKQRYDTDKFR